MKVPAIAYLLVLIPACGPMRPTADLEKIYSAAAMQEHLDRNPIIVIPGILGSRLIDDQGRTVWGQFGAGALNPASGEGRRLMALPMSASGWPRDEVRSDGTLEQVNVSLGWNFQFTAYAAMLQAFGVGGYLDPAHSDPSKVNYGPGHFTCFQFGYDWRRSCAENAALLDKFIEEKRRYVQQERLKRHGLRGDVKFDIVAHSMGGLVARYYMMYGGKQLNADGNMPVTWAGAKRVEKLIMVGTPNAGSVYLFQQLREGYKLAPFLPRIDAAVVATMPSIYELLPREEDHPVIDQDSKPIAIYKPETWQALQWGLADPAQDKVLQDLLPTVKSPEERRKIADDHLAKMLRNAIAFHRAMDRPSQPPPSVQIHAFVGDAVGTGSRMQVPLKGKPAIIDWIPGDESVTRKSVLMDRRTPAEAGQRLKSPISWDRVQFIFADHVHMTSDPTFVDNVLHLLLERQ